MRTSESSTVVLAGRSTVALILISWAPRFWRRTATTHCTSHTQHHDNARQRAGGSPPTGEGCDCSLQCFEGPLSNQPNSHPYPRHVVHAPQMAESGNAVRTMEDGKLAKGDSAGAAAELVGSGDWVDYGFPIGQPGRLGQALGGRGPELGEG